MNTLTTDLMPGRTATVAAAIGFFGIAIFQVALALGAPFGRAALGGDPRATDGPSHRKCVRGWDLGSPR